MNIKLLRRIQKQILKEPRQFDMTEWFSENNKEKIPNCGTAACIGGWAIALSTKQRPSECNVMRSRPPEDILGLDEDQENRLFYVSSWAEPWQTKYRDSVADERYEKAAQVASDYIDFFIKVDGRYCQDHPKYKGKTLPKNDCSGCHFVFKEKRDLFKLTKTK